MIVAMLGLVSLVAIVLRAGTAAYYIKWVVGRPELTAQFLTAGTFAASDWGSFCRPHS